MNDLAEKMYTTNRFELDKVKKKLKVYEKQNRTLSGELSEFAAEMTKWNELSASLKTFTG